MLKTGPAHPLALAAVALLLLNDHVLKATFHNALTGKLSDVAWMVVCPVLLAALLSHLRLPDALARGLALTVAVGSFVLLQLWPPSWPSMGRFYLWIDFSFGGRHRGRRWVDLFLTSWTVHHEFMD